MSAIKRRNVNDTLRGSDVDECSDAFAWSNFPRDIIRKTDYLVCG